MSGEVNARSDVNSSPFSSPEPGVGNSIESSDKGNTNSEVRAPSIIDTHGGHRPLESGLSSCNGETGGEHDKRTADDGGGTCRRHSASPFHDSCQTTRRPSRLILAMGAKAREAAKKAATLAHICMQWGKVSFKSTRDFHSQIIPSFAPHARCTLRPFSLSPSSIYLSIYLLTYFPPS